MVAADSAVMYIPETIQNCGESRSENEKSANPRWFYRRQHLVRPEAPWVKLPSRQQRDHDCCDTDNDCDHRSLGGLSQIPSQRMVAPRQLRPKKIAQLREPSSLAATS
jgi:hypothetical protein